MQYFKHNIFVKLLQYILKLNIKSVIYNLSFILRSAY